MIPCHVGPQTGCIQEVDRIANIVCLFVFFFFSTENGQFVIILDSQDRENEGDLIIAADAVTEAQMAFLVRYSRYIHLQQ